MYHFIPNCTRCLIPMRAMGSMRYILSIDQGTSSSRAILFNKEGKIVQKAQQKLQLYCPKPGWAELDPIAIYESVENCLKELNLTEKVSVGITNQRESLVVWNKQGEPLCNSICRNN